MFKRTTPNLMVESVNETLDFYREVLGFEVLMTVPEAGTFDWAMAGRDDVLLMFQSRASLSGELPFFAGTPIGGSFTLYTEVADVDALYAQIDGKAEIVHPMRTTFYGTREFVFKDPNGYLYSLAQNIQESESSEA